MITARDMAMATAPAMPLPAVPHAMAAPLTERILLVVLFITVLASPVAFIEPSPHDVLMGVLAITCLIASVRFERILALPLLLLLAWNVAGMMSLINVADQEKTIQYTATSIYLAIAALLFACLFTQNTMRRLATMRVAYVLTAVCGAIIGIAGYFQLSHIVDDLFGASGRARGMFKDSNVFGPFLIWPALFVLERMVTRHIRFSDLVVVGILMFGLLLSFSRGAWFHFGVSAFVMVALAVLTAPTAKTRMRVIGLTAFGTVALAAILAVLLSFDSIGQMFQERAQLIQYYDTGEGGRFRLQELALATFLNFPNGMGPFEFARVYGLQQHNVYLQAFLVYGWAGGLAYIILLLSTLFVGFRTAIMRTPWQPYLITAFAAFVGEVAEGFVIDTDHWRHFYLLLGMIWGLSAATFRQARPTQTANAAGWPAGGAR